MAVTAVVRVAFFEEEPLELAGDVWAATDLLFVLFAPLAALAEWEKVNLKPPAEVLLGRFSLSSLSLAEGQTFSCFSISCMPQSTIHRASRGAKAASFKFQLKRKLAHCPHSKHNSIPNENGTAALDMGTPPCSTHNFVEIWLWIPFQIALDVYLINSF